MSRVKLSFTLFFLIFLLNPISSANDDTVGIGASPIMSGQSSINAHTVGVGLGQTFLTGGFSELGENDITIEALYSYLASYSFDLLVNFHYSSHQHRMQSISLMGLSTGIKAKLYQFDAFAPFVLGGIGFYRPTVKRYLPRPGPGNRTELVKSAPKTTFGMHVGAGGDLKLNDKVYVGILAHYHNPFDIKQEKGNPLEGSYLKLLMTLMYSI